MAPILFYGRHDQLPYGYPVGSRWRWCRPVSRWHEFFPRQDRMGNPPISGHRFGPWPQRLKSRPREKWWFDQGDGPGQEGVGEERIGGY